MIPAASKDGGDVGETGPKDVADLTPPPRSAYEGAEKGATAPKLEAALGRRIRELRKNLQLLGAELSSRAAISPGMLSRIEHGGISPSLSTLQSLADALGVTIGELFLAKAPSAPCSLVRAGRGLHAERSDRPGIVDELIGHGIAGTTVLEPHLVRLETDALLPVLARHDHLELVFVLDGRLAYRHGDTVHRLGPGDALLFDGSAPHGPVALIESPVTYLSVISAARG